MPDPTMPLDLYPGRRRQFHRELATAGFQRAAGTPDFWVGVIMVRWQDPVTGESRRTAHRVGVELPPAFPFQRPTIIPFDEDPPIRDSRHQEPGSANGPLCLWLEGEQGWMPFMTAADLHARIKRWFAHFHQEDWDAVDRPADLHRYFPTGTGYPLMLIGDDWQVPGGAPAGRFGVWQDRPERAFAGAPALGFARPPKDHTDRILSLMGIDPTRRSYAGVWFRLQREPRPRPYLGEMLNEIDDAARQPAGWAREQLVGLYGRAVRDMTTPAIITLGYLGYEGQEVWLFLQAKLVGPPGAPGKWTKPSYLNRAPVASYETAPAAPGAMMRRTGHTARLLAGRKIVIFGQGAIGSSVALLLAKAGIPRLLLVDGERLRPGNVVRHTAGVAAIGFLKTSAARQQILAHVPDCQVEEAPITWEPEPLAELIRGADVVVDATANPAFSLLLNEICLHRGRSAIYVASYRRGVVGRLRIVRAGQDACLTCHERGYSAREGYPEIPPADEGAFVEVGCGVPTVEAAAVDIEATANWAARAVLWLLQDTLPGNLCLLVNDSMPDAVPALQQVGIQWSTWSPMERCSACGRRREAA